MTEFNEPGKYCYRNDIICEHQRIDSPDKLFACSGRNGKCVKGSKFSIPPSYLKNSINLNSIKDSRFSNG